MFLFHFEPLLLEGLIPRKRLHSIAFSIGFICSGFIAPQHVATAQIIPDITLSTTVTSSDNLNFVIENGQRTGNNLFHSFEAFSIPTGGTAHFTNAMDIQTIFSRVTGQNVSEIDTTLRRVLSR